MVAGYPSDVLQKAFNKMQNPNRNLKEMPHLPKDLPDDFMELLDAMLTYKPSDRPSAEYCLEHMEFVQPKEEQIQLDAIQAEALSGVQTGDLSASVRRHSVFMDFQHFELSLTSLLATLLNPTELDALVQSIKTENAANNNNLNIVSVAKLKEMLRERKQTKV